MSPADDPRDADAVLAAELAFGLLDGDEARAAHARVAADPAFAADYRRWQDHAAALAAGGVAEELPSASLWARIEARLPANDGAATAAQLRRWRFATALASAAALVLAVVDLRPHPAPPPVAPVSAPAAGPPLVATLVAKDRRAVLTIAFDRPSGRLTVAPEGIAIGRRAAELWVIPADGTPRSLGLIAADGIGWQAAPARALAQVTAGATLAVSVEPPGGSPTGAPTGPVILAGRIARAAVLR